MNKDITLSQDDILKLIDKVNTLNRRSKFGKGVKLYMLDILENLKETEKNTLNYCKYYAFNGTDDAQAASISGNFLVNDIDIMDRLLTKSEFKRYEKSYIYHGQTWLQLQAYAIYLAYKELYRMIKEFKEV